MAMTKNDVMDYVMNSPGNTNRAVLSSMLDSIGGGGTGNLLLHEVTETIEDEEVTRLDHTWQEIYDAAMSGAYVCQVIKQGDEEDEEGYHSYTLDLLYELSKMTSEGRYAVRLSNSGDYNCSSPTDYPIKH